jgi:DNA repair protein RadC
LNTAALIVAHNHPSGVEEPSPTEIAITEQLKHALGLIYVKMLDHFFVSADNISLLADHSLC